MELKYNKIRPFTIKTLYQNTIMLKLGEFLFKNRDYTPIPFILIMIYYAKADAQSLMYGTILVVLGELIRIIGVAHIGGVSRTKTYSTGQKLISSGPFSYVRNPLYIGNLFLSTGLTVVANVSVFFPLAFIVFFFLQYTPIINWEESNLKNVFGKEFETYLKSVPRWIPRLTPGVDNSEKIKGEFKIAIVSEKNTLSAAIVIYLIILWRSGWFDNLAQLFQS